METFLRDIRYALRMLLQSRTFSIVAILSLALGIGANTAIFSVLNTILIRPFPYAHSERLVMVWNSFQSAGLERASLSAADFADYQDQVSAFESSAAFSDSTLNLTGTAEPEQLNAFVVSPNFFEVMGIAPTLGRGFSRSEGVSGKNQVAVLSYDLWKRRFGGNTNLVGRTIHLNTKPYTVVGIMPRGMRFPDAPSIQFPERPDLWLPLSYEEFRAKESRGDEYLRMVARLKPGVTIAMAQEGVNRVGAQFAKNYPDNYPQGWKPVVVPLREQIVGDIRPTLLVLFGAVGLVLLIACVNVANLLLARASGRSREIAIRLALGAKRSRLARQILTESLLLALISGAAGIFIAYWGLDLLPHFAPSNIPRLNEVNIDSSVLLFTLGMTLLTGLLFGLAPVLHQPAHDLQENLKEGGRAPLESHGKRSFRGGLVIAEIAFAMVVLAGAGLLLETFLHLQNTDPGFRSDQVLTFYVSLPRAKYPEEAQKAQFFQQLFEKLSSLPHVRAVGGGHPLPLAGDAWGASFTIEGETIARGEPTPHASYTVVTPDFFRTLKIPLREGRFFTSADRIGTQMVVLVDEMLARKYWPGHSAIGKRINFGGDPDGTWLTIVGVVGHVRTASLREIGEQQVYLPFYQRPRSFLSVAIRSTGNLTALSSSVRGVVQNIDRDQPVAKLRPMNEIFRQAMARERFNLLLLGSFAVIALVLSAIGIYGVISFTVSQRTQEIGIRMALGAQQLQVLRMVLANALRLTIAGVAAGLIISFLLRRSVESMIYGIHSADPFTFLVISMVLASVALCASYWPASRASKVDPMEVLRYS